MIRVQNVTMRFRSPVVDRVVLDGASVTFPRNRAVALLGRNGAGKTTLLHILSGSMRPQSGHVIRGGSVSWPVGFTGSFHRDMTGVQNTRFIARIYGVDTDALLDFVQDFTKLGAQLQLPVRNLSSGMKARLAFGISMGVRFDTYLVDEVTSVGDAAFRKQSSALFKERMAEADAIVVSHSPKQLREVCNAGAVLEAGKITYYEDLEEAIAVHEANMAGVAA